MIAADRDDAPRKKPGIVFVTRQRPRCPKCQSPEFSVYGGRDQGDGSRMIYAKCKECGEKFRIVEELLELDGDSSTH